jgi:prepilin-type N-terminal cleavage/methylation domain-containing protein
MSKIWLQKGYTLVEMALVIVILGILAAVAFKSMGGTIDVSRTEETMAEMEQLAKAIAGNPNLISTGTRTDFGYVGDVGGLPPDWDALVSNPGGYATWDGPYVQDEFAAGVGNYEFKLDAWGSQYSAPTGNTFSSTGGPSIITRKIANSIGDLLYNEVVLSVTDLSHTPPGTVYRDSVKFLLTYPNGAGGISTDTEYPSANGLARFDSIPIGIHSLRMIYIPNNDTIRRKIAINPGHDFHADLQHFDDLW